MEKWDFLDILSVMSFCIGLQNLDLNISQDDLQKNTERLDESLRKNVEEIHKHLEMQDEKIERILRHYEDH